MNEKTVRVNVDGIASVSYTGAAIPKPVSVYALHVFRG
jgi:hypothetical protein